MASSPGAPWGRKGNLWGRGGEGAPLVAVGEELVPKEPLTIDEPTTTLTGSSGKTKRPVAAGRVHRITLVDGPRAQPGHTAVERRALRAVIAVGLKPAATCKRLRLSVTKLCAGPARGS